MFSVIFLIASIIIKKSCKILYTCIISNQQQLNHKIQFQISNLVGKVKKGEKQFVWHYADNK